MTPSTLCARESRPISWPSGRASAASRAGDPGAPRKTGDSVLITFKHEPGSSDPSREEYERTILLPLFGRLQATEYRSATVRYLRENGHHGLRTAGGNVTRSWLVEAPRLALSARRIPRPYRHPVFNPSIDLLVKIDLEETLTRPQLDALGALRAELESAGRVHIAKSTNYRVYERGTPRNSDTPMGFLTRWRSDSSFEQQDTYWREGHGRYAAGLGLPQSIRSYDQLHHGHEPPESDVFDGPGVGHPQGWSFETVAGPLPILRLTLNFRNLLVNWKLIADERKFTQSAEWLVFERVDLGHRQQDGNGVPGS